MKVLIIDDEPLVRRSLSRGFQSRGHQLFEASEGKSGVEIWRKEKPDLVFLDILMPEMTGWEVLQVMGLELSSKVILMSAYTGDDRLEKMKDYFDLFIVKPFEDIFKLIEQAEQLVEKASS